MARNKARIPVQRTQSGRERLAAADTSSTTSEDDIDVPTYLRTSKIRGETVEVPNSAMMGAPPNDWGKIGTYVASATFILGILGAAVWQFSDTVSSVKNLGEDMKDVKRKSDDLLKISLDSTARISALERSNNGSNIGSKSTGR